ncbi:flagellar protein FlaG [Clostridium tepidiprofundi DSM 19306]|uniref:Flagellar protein FlaG n=1 Tax=Clostridium tepidiprofundi DSM 19306 TaxID=1121338 RepID=A0A151B4E8_9CLOT|nr:flagellar protein FlaG [Clostridium tepidiprofundi]KYH34801.1 flagellar protein FlaG [Clostridium tepidiprofundi DSM 19306]
MDINKISCVSGNINSNQYVDDKAIATNANIVNNSDGLNGVDDDTKKYSEKDVKYAADILDKILEKNKSHIEIERHKVFNDLIIKIVDDKTKQVIKEIPPEKILDMVAQMCKMVGVILDEKA